MNITSIVFIVSVFMLANATRADAQPLCNAQGVSPPQAQAFALQVVRSVGCALDLSQTGFSRPEEAASARVGACILSENGPLVINDEHPFDYANLAGIRLTYPVFSEASLEPVAFVTVQAQNPNTWIPVAFGPSRIYARKMQLIREHMHRFPDASDEFLVPDTRGLQLEMLVRSSNQGTFIMPLADNERFGFKVGVEEKLAPGLARINRVAPAHFKPRYWRQFSNDREYKGAIKLLEPGAPKAYLGVQRQRRWGAPGSGVVAPRERARVPPR